MADWNFGQAFANVAGSLQQQDIPQPPALLFRRWHKSRVAGGREIAADVLLLSQTRVVAGLL